MPQMRTNKPAGKLYELDVISALQERVPVIQQNGCTDEELKGEVCVDSVELRLWTIFCKHHREKTWMWEFSEAPGALFPGIHLLCFLVLASHDDAPGPPAVRWAPGGHNSGSQTSAELHCAQTLFGNRAGATSEEEQIHGHKNVMESMKKKKKKHIEDVFKDLPVAEGQALHVVFSQMSIQWRVQFL